MRLFIPEGVVSEDGSGIVRYLACFLYLAVVHGD
jgi:hypothetical protein